MDLVSLVYVVQRPHADRFDLSPARAHGDLVYLLSPTANPFRSEPLVEELHQKLRHYRGSQDYLLLLGNPCVIGWVVAIAAHYGGGKVRQLQWDGYLLKYNVIDTDLLLR